ncbi:OmpA family protein [Pseudaestuariivita atlantica]|uniref:OmpA family protein n=1 Tax=Pseudaestuariivita atlantica TaxID=1317121 RepID=UPI00067D834D|nr:OmpA family protein [Pseudaestuariivita atlantica]
MVQSRFATVLAGCVAAWALAQSAAALTAEECREVTEKYGVRAIGCDGPSEPVAEATPDLQRLMESHIFFATGDTLKPGEAQRLALLARVLDTSVLQDACLRLVGHSDSSGPADANLTVSRKRVERVASYLAGTIADRTRIVEVLAMGEQELLVGFAPDATENRRVAIYAKPCRPN